MEEEPTTTRYPMNTKVGYYPTPIQPGLMDFYNYQCPKCGGKFKRPACKGDTGYQTKPPTYYCPFCGKSMKGLNKVK